MKDDGGWITVAEAADLSPDVLGLSEKRIYRLVADNVVPMGAALRIGRRLFIHWPSFQEWLRGGGAAFDHGWRRSPPNTEERQQERR